MKNTILILLVAITSFGCAQQSEEAGVDGTKAIAKRVSKSEFKSELMKHDTIQLIDVRTPSEYANGTIENAINIDFMGDDFVAEINKLDKTLPTLIFCQSGGRSSKALKLFLGNGFDYTLELEGGYGNW